MRSVHVLPMVVIALGGVIVTAVGAPASQGTELTPGSRIRMTVAPVDSGASPAAARPLEGVLVGLIGDQFHLRQDAGGQTLAISRDRLSRLEVSRGTHGRSARWAAVGLVVGFLAGIPVGSAAGSDNFIGSPGQWALAYGAGFGLVGALLGAGLGAADTVEDWEPVPLDPQRALHDAPRPGRVTRVALRTRF